MMSLLRTTGIVLSVVLMGSLKAQSVLPLSTKSCHPQLKTLQVITEGDFMRLPVIDTEGSTTLSISFDWLGDEQPWIDYTLVHCNAEWQPDDLDVMDCLEYSYLPLHTEQIEPSFNTFLSYFHYEVAFPNADIRPTISGNYAMLFHLQDEPDSLLAIACFMVSEKLAFVSGSVSSNTDIGFQAQHQQLSLEVAWSENKMPHLEPTTDLRLLVQQNLRQDNQRWIEHPTRVQKGRATYEHERQLIFEAGNHWRRFEFTDERYPGLGVDHVRYQAPIYCAYLNPDKARSTDNYRFDQDQRGRYKVHALHVQNENTEAEYFRAIFTLDAPARLDAQGVYLIGGFTHQVIDASTRMEYDVDRGLYYKELLLKEGAYNYQYLTPVPGGTLTGAYTEGNHYETPNEYQVFIYYHPFGSRYDRLIGTAILQ